MKKYRLMASILACTMALGFSSLAFANEDGDGSGDVSKSAIEFDQAGYTILAGDKTIGKLSSGVGLVATLDSDNKSGYALITAHKSGTKAFGTAHDSTAIYTANINKAKIGQAPTINAPTKAAAAGSFYKVDENTGEPGDAEEAGGDLDDNWKAM